MVIVLFGRCRREISSCNASGFGRFGSSIHYIYITIIIFDSDCVCMCVFSLSLRPESIIVVASRTFCFPAAALKTVKPTVKLNQQSLAVIRFRCDPTAAPSPFRHSERSVSCHLSRLIVLLFDFGYFHQNIIHPLYILLRCAAGHWMGRYCYSCCKMVSLSRSMPCVHPLHTHTNTFVYARASLDRPTTSTIAKHVVKLSLSLLVADDAVVAVVVNILFFDSILLSFAKSTHKLRPIFSR